MVTPNINLYQFLLALIPFCLYIIGIIGGKVFNVTLYVILLYDMLRIGR